MADVFISYAREDRPQAELVARGLTSMGLEAFWDTEIPPGQTWSDYIEAKLAQCRAVVVLWSQHSTKSQWVREEARMGRDKSKLIPALLDGTPAPLGFGEVQAADLSNWRGEANNPEWVRFSRAVHVAARGADAPAPPPQGVGWTAPQVATPGADQSAGGSASTRARDTLHTAIGYIQKCLRLYFDGKGRARRAEYWWWFLFAVLVSVAAGMIDGSFGVDPYTGAPNSQLVSGVAGLALLAPWISVLSRRLHDINLSGWLASAVVIVAIIGGALSSAAMPVGEILSGVAGLALIVIGAMPGKPGENPYGPDPKAS